MRKALLLVLLAGSITFLPQVRGEERGVVVEGPAARLPDPGGNWAVVVGVNQFEDQGIHPLSYAVADAQAIAEELTQVDGLIPRDQIYLHISGGGLEPTRGSILKSIKFAVEHVPADGLVLIYLSSHGFLDEQKRSYVMPKDGHTDLLEDTALSVVRIQELLSPHYCKAAKRLLIVDACRDEPLRSSRGGGEEVSSSFTEQLRQARGMVTMVSCGAEEVSYEDDKFGHGVFSFFLLDGLRGAAGRDHQGFITVSTLADYVSQRVESWCKQAQKTPFQTPWIHSEVNRSIPLACPGTGRRPTVVDLPQVRPTPTSITPISVPSSNVFESEEHGFRIERPNASWKIITGEAELKDLNEGAVVAFESEEGVTSTVIIEHLPQVQLNDYVSAVTPPNLGHVDLLSEERGTLTGLPAQKQVWRGRYNGVVFRFFYTFAAMGNDRIQIVSWFAETVLTEALVKQINTLEDSFGPFQLPPADVPP